MDNESYERWAEVVKVLGHPVRLKIIAELLTDEKSVTTICGTLHLPQPTVSQHLALLRNRGIVKDERCGSQVKYAIRGRWIGEMMRVMRGEKLT